jgi:phospholipid/cholesterol/gamma-HCH transport system substrate-binding protein
METNVNYTIVGIFVIVLTSFVVMAIIWLSSGFAIARYSIYKVYMKESVSGLTVDSAVEFNGVNVGTVKRIEISKKNPNIVILLLNVKSSTPVTQATRAMLNSKGLTGVTFMALQDDGTNTQPLLAAKNEDYPVINTTPSLFMRFDTALVKINENFQKITHSIQSLLNPENLQAVKQILQNTSLASEHFNPLMLQSMSAVQLLTSQTLPTATRTMSNMEQITHNMVSVSSELKENPSAIIRGTAPPELGPGER